jgi:hypothetical protein
MRDFRPRTNALTIITQLFLELIERGEDFRQPSLASVTVEGIG